MKYVRCTGLVLLALALPSACGGCGDDDLNAASVLDVGTPLPDTAGDSDAHHDLRDATHVDATATADSGHDAAQPDASDRDASEPDAGEPDSGEPDAGEPDAGEPDAGEPDSGEPDAGEPDAGPPVVCGDGVVDLGESCDDGVTTDCVTTHDGGDGTCVPVGQCSAGYALAQGTCVLNPTGLTTPCANGPGWTLFRYHYSNNSTSARIDVWDAACSYSLAPNSLCEVRQICPGFCDVNTTSAGYPIFTTTHYMRVRFNVNGLNFNRATLWIRAAGYAGSTTMRAWSPLYGDVVSDIVSGFNYGWYSLDWSNHLSPTDPPSLTAVQLYANSSSIAVSAVEMCVE